MERRNSAAANSGEDEDFARIANRFEDATGAHIAVDGDSDGRLDIAIFDDVFAQAGILAFEVVEKLADIPAGGDDPVFATSVFTQQCGDDDDSHDDRFILAQRVYDGDGGGFRRV
jgi:hypothetical protein